MLQIPIGVALLILSWKYAEYFFRLYRQGFPLDVFIFGVGIWILIPLTGGILCLILPFIL